MLPDPLRLPRYLDACVTQLLPDAVAAVSGHTPRTVPFPADLHAVVVLVVDGMGRRLLDAHGDVASFLASAAGTTLDAVFPATTVTNLTSLATGLTPRQHGIAGTVLGVDGRRFLPLSWSWDRLVGGEDARCAVVPERQQPLPTLFERMRANGVRPVTVFRPDHVASGLTRSSLRGGDVRAADGLETTLTTALTEATAAGTPTVVYAHHADLDTAGHLQGPGSPRWCAELKAVDDAVARAAENLPAGVALVVTADHGQASITDDGIVELTQHPELLDGVRAVGGDPRAPQLHVVDGAARDVAAAWREACGDAAAVRTRDAAVAEGWFGPPIEPAGAIDERLAGRDARPASIGDVIVAAREPAVWVHADLDNRGGRMPGHHASLTSDELEVPVLVLT